MNFKAGNMSVKNLVYSFSCLSFCIVIGGAVYEHIAVVPQWASGPPVSLSMFQGKYGLKPAPFWKMIHPVTLLLMGLSLVLYWRTGRMRNLLVTMIGYVLILVITFGFFVPELIAITETGYAELQDPGLTGRAKRWEQLSLARLGLLILLALVLLGPQRAKRLNLE